MSKATDDLLAVLQNRGEQYGSETDDKANLRESTRLGVDPLTGVLVRMGDKWSRIVNLTAAARRGEVIDIWQLRDNILDLSGYGVKALELLDERLDSSVDAPGGGETPHTTGDNAEDRPSFGRWVRSVLGGERGIGTK